MIVSSRMGLVKWLGASVMLLMLAGCATGEGISGDGQPSAVKLADDSGSGQQQGPDRAASIPGIASGYVIPTLQQGDSFTFDAPMSTWHVDAVRDGKAYWSGDNGGTQVTSLNPLFPALAWSSQSMGSGTRKIGEIKGDLFPLKQGSNVTFQTIVTSSKASGLATFYWSCTALSSQSTTVPAGTFDTVKVRCERQGSGVWTFYYAPNLGYYVMVEHVGTEPGQTNVRRLVSYSRPSLNMGVSNDLQYSDKDAQDSAVSQSAQSDIAMAPRQNNMINGSDVVVSSHGRYGRNHSSKSMVAGEPCDNAADHGMYGVHVVSFKDKARLKAGYNNFVAQYKDVLGAHVTPYIEQIHIPQKGGVFYRILVGSMSKQEATDICRKIRQRGVSYCRVASLDHAKKGIQ